MQTRNADRRCLCPVWRCCHMNSCRYVSKKALVVPNWRRSFHFALVHRFSTFCVWMSGWTVSTIFLMDHNFVEAHASVQLTYVVVGPPTIRHYVGARKAPLPDQSLQCRFSSVAYHCHTTQPTFPLVDRKHPNTFH